MTFRKAEASSPPPAAAFVAPDKTSSDLEPLFGRAPIRTWRRQAIQPFLLKSDLILLASECFLLESGLNQRPSERLLPQSERLLLQSALNQPTSECFLLKSDLILLRSE